MSFRTARRLAGLVALAAAALAVFLVWHGSHRPNAFLNQSWATVAAIGALGVVAVVGACLFFLTEGEQRWKELLQAWRRLSPPKGNAGVCFVLVALAMGVHGELAARQRPYKNAAYIDDEADYLRVANEIERLPGGFAALLPALFRGEFAEDNRHPLYPALLAAGNQIKIDDRPALIVPTLLSTAFGLFVVLATAIIGWKFFGPTAGALSSLLVAINRALVESSSLVACETLLVLLTTVGWYAFAAGRPLSTTRALLVGALFGLAYLTKASAAFPLSILLALTLIPSRLAPPRRRLVATSMVLGFLLVASPLLVRNVRRFGNPLHSFNNKLLFAESYEAGIADPDLGTFRNLQRFLSRHSAREIVVNRFLGGLLWEGFVLLRSVGPIPFDSGRAVVGALMLAAAGIGLITKTGRKLAPAFLVCWTAWFVIFFGWYQPIASGDRFLLPLLPPLSIAAVIGLLGLARAVLPAGKNSA